MGRMCKSSRSQGELLLNMSPNSINNNSRCDEVSKTRSLFCLEAVKILVLGTHDSAMKILIDCMVEALFFNDSQVS